MTTLKIELPPELADQLKGIQSKLDELATQIGSADEWMTTEEAAAHLKISPDTLRKRANDGRIKAHRSGKNFRFRRADLNQAA